MLTERCVIHPPKGNHGSLRNWVLLDVAACLRLARSVEVREGATGAGSICSRLPWKQGTGTESGASRGGRIQFDEVVRLQGSAFGLGCEGGLLVPLMAKAPPNPAGLARRCPGAHQSSTSGHRHHLGRPPWLSTRSSGSPTALEGGRSKCFPTP